MNNEEKKSIFISWSKRYSGEIAEIIKQWLDEYLGDKIDIFISHEIQTGDNWAEVIDKQLRNSKIGILILTPENINSAWVLFESGALYGKGTILPLLCGRNAENIEGPFEAINHAKFDEDGVKGLLMVLNNLLELGMTKKSINAITKTTWDELSIKINPLIKESKFYMPSPEESGLKVRDQNKIDLCSAKLFRVQEQVAIETQIILENSLKVEDIPISFRSYLNTQIPNKYKIQDKQSDGTMQTRVMINDTRISNFVSFTDKKRIALFNRPRANVQQVDNQNYDVFGAVTFENNSLFFKIQSESFKQARILEVHEIPGFAFEDNINKYKETETVLMFGYSVVVSNEDLNLVMENNDNSILLWHINDEILGNLTSKAELACNFSKRKYLQN